MGTKWYEVNVIAQKTVVIEIDEDSTHDFEDLAKTEACSEAFSGCQEVEANDIVELIGEHKIKQAKILADEVMAL